MRLIPLLALLCLGAGCTADKATPVTTLGVNPSNEDTNANSNANLIADVAAEPLVTSSLKRQTETLKPNGRSYLLNGDKYTADTPRLVTGTAVFNPNMSESGVLKGSFVVQSKQTVNFVEPSFTIETIASETYRLTPVDNNADLYELYLMLKGHEKLILVEIEIDYSGRSKAEYY
ncbi:hypothetical protein [Shewanella sp. 30m-9]